MKGRKIIKDSNDVQEVKERIIDNLKHYGGRITNESTSGFVFKKSMWTSKYNPLRSVSVGEVRVYKELDGITVEYDISGNAILNILGVIGVIWILFLSFDESAEKGLFVAAIAAVVIPSGIFYDRYRVLRLLR